MDINVVLVPVMISYDRLFEANYIAEGVFEGTKHPESSMTQLSKRILMPQANSLGNVFIKYLEPIQLKDYILREKKLDLNASAAFSSLHLEQISAKLTEDMN